jgi:hypothetical protein
MQGHAKDMLQETALYSRAVSELLSGPAGADSIECKFMLLRYQLTTFTIHNRQDSHNPGQRFDKIQFR